MLIYFLNKLRKIFKSIGKKEYLINNLIIYLKFKKKNSNKKISNKRFKSLCEKKIKSKPVAVISFLFNEKKIINLKKVCAGLRKISNQIVIYIVINKVNKNKIKLIKKKLDIRVKIIVINDLPNQRFLPWYQVNIMKKLYKNKTITHFIYLEDDIFFEEKNFRYWLNSRNILKKFNLIPGFVRIEKDKKTKRNYAVDIVKKTKVKDIPRLNIDDEYYFVNNIYPYQGMYIYDRYLMKEYLFGPSSNPDFGNGSYNPNFIDKRMLDLSLLEKANIGLTYYNYPKTFFNRIVIPVNIRNKTISKVSQIHHLSNNYIKHKNSIFGKINIDDVMQ